MRGRVFQVLKHKRTTVRRALEMLKRRRTELKPIEPKRKRTGSGEPSSRPHKRRRTGSTEKPTEDLNTEPTAWRALEMMKPTEPKRKRTGSGEPSSGSHNRRRTGSTDNPTKDLNTAVEMLKLKRAELKLNITESKLKITELKLKRAELKLKRTSTEPKRKLTYLTGSTENPTEDLNPKPTEKKPTEEVPMSEKLRSLGLKLNVVRGDGNCLFRAISHQLHGCEHSHHKAYREEIASYMLKRPQLYRELALANKDENLHLNEVEKAIAYSLYCEKLKTRSDFWGGSLEINAAARLTRCRIKVYMEVDLDQAPEVYYPIPRTAVRRTINLLYNRPKRHYSSLTPLPELEGSLTYERDTSQEPEIEGWLDYENLLPLPVPPEEMYDQMVAGLARSRWCGRFYCTIVVGFTSVMVPEVLHENFDVVYAYYYPRPKKDPLNPQTDAFADQAADIELEVITQRWIDKLLPAQRALVGSGDKHFIPIVNLLTHAGHETMVVYRVEKRSDKFLNFANVRMVQRRRWVGFVTGGKNRKSVCVQESEAKDKGKRETAKDKGKNQMKQQSQNKAQGTRGRQNKKDRDLKRGGFLLNWQLAVYGRETTPMRRLFASNVLISGMHGLGAEIAKNLILAGVKSVTLHDERVVELWDLSSNFVFSEDDVGKNRADASVHKLQDLNNAVVVSSLTTSLTKEHLSGFQVVVVSDISMEKAIEFNDYCHSHQPPIAFVKADVRGLFGSVFCDFGPEFTVLDVDGEEPHTGIIASISNENQAFISCVDDERLEFQDGDLVVFSEVEGMTELNDGKPRKIKSARPYSFILEEDTTGYGTYVKGGIVTQVKQPKLLNFKPLREALSDPGDFLFSDFSKFDRPPLLHLAFQALDRFTSEAGRFPVAGSEEDAQQLISIATAINTGQGDLNVDNVDHKLLRNFAFGAKAVLNPMAAMFGGIVGQEVVKACSGKFHPLFQFFYFDSVESLPSEPLDSSDVAPRNSRYDAQISVFGAKFQQKLEDAKVFTVGSGALGCEFLKNIALMGVSCGDQGKLTVTDDIIEKSNLSRQFLFRDWNIGQAKSTVAASAAAAINPKFNIEALQNRVGAETENVFDDAFWENLTVVVNALDNVNARLYVDSRCLYFQKPLLESGTLGAKCNTQMVIPHLTENYGASRDPPEIQAPVCTVHSFQHNIDHCLTWARSEFEGLLEKTPAEVNAYLSSPVEYTNSMMIAGDAQARDTLERIVECLDKEKCENFQDCLTWARLRFEDYFVNRVKQLIYTFPEDAATSTGAPFWSAPKRFPRPLQYSSSDPSLLNFITATAILRAETFGIPVPEWTKDPKAAAEAIDNVIVPDFEPRKDAKIVTDEKATSLTTASVDDAAVINDLIAKLEKCRHNLSPDFRMKPIQFEKDDDTNYHMDVIAGLANMRARNYSIPEVDKLKAKFIAGRIIPAIATSTAMATGLVCLELYKVLDGGHKVEAYRNTFANLALPLFSMAEPVPPKVVKHRDMAWTVWDRWVLKGNPTLREVLQWLEDKGLNAYSISCGSCLLFNSMFPRHKERMDKKVVDLAWDIAKVELPPYRRHLDVVVACEDEDDNDVDIPLVSIYFR